MVDYATTSIKKLEYTKIKMVDGTTRIKCSIKAPLRKKKLIMTEMKMVDGNWDKNGRL